MFAWLVANMLEIDPKFMSHQLSVFLRARPVAPERRRMSQDKALTVQEQFQSILDVGFIREIVYPTWLSNVIMVKKSNGKWRMCVDYSDLNKACPKDPYLLPSIDGLVDAASEYRFLSFMNAYLWYNQIPIHLCDKEKTTFITPMANYCYKVMSFNLKDTGVTYHKLMNKVFSEHIGDLMEVYIDNILVKIKKRRQSPL